jgi:hypothetical protein
MVGGGRGDGGGCGGGGRGGGGGQAGRGGGRHGGDRPCTLGDGAVVAVDHRARTRAPPWRGGYDVARTSPLNYCAHAADKAHLGLAAREGWSLMHSLMVWPCEGWADRASRA